MKERTSKSSDVEKEFMQMIRQNNGVIYKVASFYVDKDNVIDDLYQEVVLNLWKAYPHFRGESKYSTWIYRIALNTCISFYRKSSRKPMYVELSHDVKADTEDNSLYKKELYALIDKLDKLERALILLYLEDRPQKEMAEIMGITPTNVSTKLNRIREKLKRMSDT
ncbi:sigma-70 family RNA polymerase sigma factor [Bacteroides sp. OttesenSCG-928-N06]|nr:sigma-70 family RNA polymerase sigma factor [Bacteroides sp. OttesenSCG-928-N06]